MTRVRIFGNAVSEVCNSRGVWLELEKQAEHIKGRTTGVPHTMRLWIKRGKGPKGAFAQLIMEGPGAIAIEYGTRTRAPKAPLRKALRG